MRASLNSGNAGVEEQLRVAGRLLAARLVLLRSVRVLAGQKQLARLLEQLPLSIDKDRLPAR